jgi:uncharacterized membrane protein
MRGTAATIRPAALGCALARAEGDSYFHAYVTPGSFKPLRLLRTLPMADWLSLLALAGAALYTLEVYPRLPDPMPSHFGLNGTADGWLPRPMCAWLLLLTGLGLGALVRLAPWLMPRKWRAAFRASPVSTLGLLTVALFYGTYVLLLNAAMGPAPHLGGAMFVLGGLALIVAGQLMTRTRRNPLFGFRTNWSMASDENWDLAQRFGRRACAVGGVSMAVFGALGMPVLAFAALLTMGGTKQVHVEAGS